MAISRLTTITEHSDTSTPLDTSFSHTVDSGATLLLLAFTGPADLVFSSPVWNSSESMTEITNVTTSSNSNDQRCWLYGLINPTATTANISFSVSGSDNFGAVAWQYSGTDTASIAAATNVIDTEDNLNNVSTTIALSGTTTSGSCLIIFGGFHGGDGDPASETNDGGFVEVAAGASGASGISDSSWYVGEDIDGGTGGTVSPTITWSANDECVGVFVELIAASAGAGPFHPYYDPRSTRNTLLRM